MALIKLNNRAVKDASAFGSVTSLGSLSLIQKQTASSSATVDFTSGIDSTYKEYIFYFVNMHPSSNASFTFQGNAVGGSGFNETMTTTFFYAYHKEDGSDTSLMYNTGHDQAQGTGYQTISADATGTDNDNCLSGYLHIFNPSSTTFVKHYISRMSNTNGGGSTTYMCDCYGAGYFNTTSAIDEISFKFGSGNIDAGDILLYGVN
ncbi:hypothetical protein HTVC034P_gp35 [Pelagibacter phage HTVC034P]|nr:hypothetical protein HTVC034P_gp35 [Pelagibacter phage HTVC034P]